MNDQELAYVRRHVNHVLRMKGAHLTFDAAVADFPVELRGMKPAGFPHSAWELLEHLRLAQDDILDFSRNPNYKERKFPDDYWPPTPEPPSADAWDNSVRQFQKQLKEMQALVDDPASDLFVKLPHGQGQTLLREALLVADHNAYHLGQLVLVRKILEANSAK